MARRYQAPARTLSEIVDGEAVLLNVDTGQYYSLNRTGTRMWQLMRELGSESAVVAAMLAEVQADPALLRADVARLADDLASRGLLEVNDGA